MSDDRGRVRIVSDGETLPNVVAVRWECNVGERATASLELVDVEIDAICD